MSSYSTMTTDAHLAPERALHPLNTATVRIPSFRESGFDALANATPADAQPRSATTSYPSAQSLGEYHFNRADHSSYARFAPGVEQNPRMPMYTFNGNRSPISPMMSEPSPAMSSAPHLLDPATAKKGPRKEPCPRPAAKRMRDTRDREGKTLKDLEDELEFEGRLGGAKRLNANNKDESGRRFSRADILEAEYESRKYHCSRNKVLMSILARVQTCQSSSNLDEIKKEIGSILAGEISPLSASYPPQEQRHYDSGYSETSTSDHERRSPSSWSTTEPDYTFRGYNRESLRLK